DQFRFLYESNLVTYTGHVRVDDVQMELTCDLLNIKLSSNGTNKGIQKITAEDHVMVINKKDNSRATGERAIYIVNTNQETVALMGNPKWEDGLRVGTADLFFFDRRSNIFRAENNAKFKMPREQLGHLDLLNANATMQTNAPTNQFVVITSDLMTFKLGETNGSIQEIVADSNVVMLSESDQSRATGSRAVYTESSGLMELTGNPEWRIKENSIRAEILIVGKTNRYFAARTNVQMRMPANLFAKKLGSTNAAGTAQRVVDVFCEDFSYATNIANFSKNVRANLSGENDSQTTLLCDFTTLYFGASDQLEKVVANGNVVFQEIPGTVPQTNLLKKILTCQSLTLHRSIDTGFITSVHAEKNVVAEQIDKIRLGERLKRISGEFVDVKFQERSNQVASVTGHGNMVAQKIDRLGDKENTAQAFGERVAYDAVTETVELTGTPSAKMDDMLIYDATFLRWNLKSGKVSAMPYKVIPLNSTNALKALRKR
ncbi:MAG: LptA/OstA family protein, partial [Verrucomicrobiota bacterium]